MKKGRFVRSGIAEPMDQLDEQEIWLIHFVSRICQVAHCIARPSQALTWLGVGIVQHLPGSEMLGN